jgi:hypothetical protein
VIRLRAQYNNKIVPRAGCSCDIIIGHPCVVSHEKAHLITKRYVIVHVGVYHHIVSSNI